MAEVPNKESNSLPTCPPDEPLPDTKVDKDETAQDGAPAQAETTASTATLPERPKETYAEEKETATDSGCPVKRPYERSLFAKEESKPPKIAKVDEPTPAQQQENVSKPASRDTAQESSSDLPKTEPVGVAAIAPEETPNVTAKAPKDVLSVSKETVLQGSRESTEDTTPSAAASAGTVEENALPNKIKQQSTGTEAEDPLTSSAAEATALEKESNVAEVSGAATGATGAAPVESTDQAAAAATTSKAAPAAGKQGKSRAEPSSSDAELNARKLKEEELRKAEARVEAHKDAIRELMTDETNPELRAQTLSQTEEAKEGQSKAPAATTEENGAVASTQKQDGSTLNGRASTDKKKTTTETPADTIKGTASAKEARKKGGVWSWLKRKVKGA